MTINVFGVYRRVAEYMQYGLKKMGVELTIDPQITQMMAENSQSLYPVRVGVVEDRLVLSSLRTEDWYYG